MDFNLKQAFYRTGRYRLTQAPTTATWHWDEKDWIQWIDEHGVWELPGDAAEPDRKQAFGHQWERDPDTGRYTLQLSA